MLHVCVTCQDLAKTTIAVHQKKIKLSPPTRKELCRELEHETALVVHKKMADKIMNTGDSEPFHMPTVGCLRQIKHEFNSSEHYHQVPILSLWMMTQVSPYKEIIRQISLFPFFYYIGCLLKRPIT